MVRRRALAPIAALALVVLAWIVLIHSSILQNNAFTFLRGERSKAARSLRFHPVKDSKNGTSYVFMSQIQDTNRTGVPEFFYFNTSASSRVLCFRGNSTRDGTKNLYAFAEQHVPGDALLLPGTTLVSDSHFDFANPWHSMYNLIQFVHWRMDSRCQRSDRMLIFHRGEIRHDLGAWIRSVLDSNGVTTGVDTMRYHPEGRVVCFQRAVVSRRGIGGVSGAVLRDLFEQVRCRTRQWCGVGSGVNDDDTTVRVALVARERGRAFVNLSDWKHAVKLVCEVRPHCQWSVVWFSALDFCSQVKLMSTTDILVSVHGAQLTNMIFMNPGSRILEAFPQGWLQLAGNGQFIYKHLADWAGLGHEGYWRDGGTAKCPMDSSSPGQCFSLHYKNKPVGINSTFIVKWLAEVLSNFSCTARASLTKQECKCSVEPGADDRLS
ncbi:hypothetical protein SELMODRAFT_130433 [Selaginella moellendorffii]|uniref:Glycosyltransferase 61 catalytic domain-containing protein n=3 Tax=Selaginella moellendorffii TaxID=88036 RepID=D8T261_SELML|nr:hypothetical protein SELMODRAFT_130433 [Selaginella moellendorffii]